MNSLEHLAQAWVEQGWMPLLAFTLASGCVALLRRPCRAWFGAERACQLWLLLPLAMIATQLPHRAALSSPLPPVVLNIADVAHALPVMQNTPAGGSLLAVLLALWLLGLAGVGGFSWCVQRRYRRGLAGAKRMSEPSLRWPVWRSDRAMGPATVGAWRPFIVLPVDFETRYDEAERALVLAPRSLSRPAWRWLLHVVCAGARGALLVPPLGMVGGTGIPPRPGAGVRCGGDARQVRAAAGLRPGHVEDPLGGFRVPVGCCWLSRHPITERIAMLNRTQPGSLHRRAGAVLLALLATGLASVVYAASQPSAAVKVGAASRYTLKLELGIDGQPARLHSTSCLRPGQYYETLQGGIDPLPPWRARFTVAPAAGGLLELQAQLSGGSLDHPVYPRLLTRPGQQATIQVGRMGPAKSQNAAGNHTLKADLTPAIGC